MVSGLVGAIALFAVVRLIAPESLVTGSWAAKTTAAPLSLIHAILAFATLLAVLFRYDSFRAFAPWNAVFTLFTVVGRNSLQAFMASVVLDYGMVLAWVELGGGTGIYLLVALLGVCALVAYAFVVEAVKRARNGRFDLPGHAARSGSSPDTTARASVPAGPGALPAPLGNA